MKNKDRMIQASLCGMLLIVAAITAPGAWAGEDEDESVNPVPGFVQAFLCGPELTRDAINEKTEWHTGQCQSAEAYEHPVLTRTVCEECEGESLMGVVDETLVDNRSTPPVPLDDVDGTQLDEGTVDHPVGTLEGQREEDHPEGPRYCLYFTPEGGERELLQCVDPTGLVLPVLPEFERELVREPVEDVPLTPLVEEGEVLESQESPRVSYDLHVGYRWNPELLHMQVGPGLVEFWSPVNVGDSDAVDWWWENGYLTSFDVVFVMHVEGEGSQGVGVHWPFLGQVLAASDKNQDGSGV